MNHDTRFSVFKNRLSTIPHSRVPTPDSRRRRINKPTTSDRAEKEMTAIYRAIVVYVYGPAASCPVRPVGKRVVRVDRVFAVRF